MITPNTVHFNYKKFAPIPPGVILYHNQTFQSLPIALLTGIPSWLEVYDITLISFKVRVVALPANGLSVGTHQETVTITFQDSDTSEHIILGSFDASIDVEDTVVLNVSPVNLNYQYLDGGAAPIEQTVSVASENNWTVSKNQSWITLSATTGNNSGSFAVGVDVSGLTPNLYTGVVTVNDGVNTREIAINLTVGEPNTATDFLYVTPNDLAFGFTVGGNIPPFKNIQLNASGNWAAAVSHPWLELSAVSGSSGIVTIQASLKAGVDLDALTEGRYIGTISFNNGNINRIITVELEVYDFTSGLPSNAELLFTDDDNMILLGSPRLDSYFELDYNSVYKSKAYFFQSRIPIFKGGASKRIGSIPKKLIGPQNLIGLADFAVFQPYSPLVLSLTMKERELFTDAVLNTSNLDNLKFIAGSKPTNNWLSEVSKTVYLTKNAVLCFSVLSNQAVENSIVVSGDISGTINVTDFTTADKWFYTVVLPISSLGNLDPGTEVSLTFYNETINVVIKEDEIDQTMIFWENQYRCIDALELTGEVTITPSLTRTTAKFRKDHKTIETKVIDVTNPNDYVVNTGYIHTKEEIDMIYNMLGAKRVWLQHNNQVVQVIPATNKVPAYKTLRELNSFNITFKNVNE